MIFVLFPIKLRLFKNKFFIKHRRHLKHIFDGEYMCDKISCLRSYFYNFLALLHCILISKCTYDLSKKGTQKKVLAKKLFYHWKICLIAKKTFLRPLFTKVICAFFKSV